VELKSDGPGGHKAIVRPRGRSRFRRKIRAWSRASYRPDGWRAGQVRNMGAIEMNVPVSDNDWETITGGGDAAIQRWIAARMRGKPCAASDVSEKHGPPRGAPRRGRLAGAYPAQGRRLVGRRAHAANRQVGLNGRGAGV